MMKAMAQAGTPEGGEEDAAAQSFAEDAQLPPGQADEKQPDRRERER